MTLDRDAILGIIFGSIFGVVFAAICIISAIKAVRDRKRIKAKIAEAKEKRQMKSNYEAICQENGVLSSIEDRHALTSNGQKLDAFSIYPSPIDLKQLEVTSSSKLTDDYVNRTEIIVEVNSLSTKMSEDTPKKTHNIIDKATNADLTTLYNRTMGSKINKTLETGETSSLHNHNEIHETDLERKRSWSYDEGCQQFSKSRNNIKPQAAWMQNHTSNNVTNISVESTNEVIGSNSHGASSSTNENSSRWRDKTYFGTRNGSTTMVVGRMNKGRAGYHNAAFE